MYGDFKYHVSVRKTCCTSFVRRGQPHAYQRNKYKGGKSFFPINIHTLTHIWYSKVVYSSYCQHTHCRVIYCAKWKFSESQQHNTRLFLTVAEESSRRLDSRLSYYSATQTHRKHTDCRLAVPRRAGDTFSLICLFWGWNLCHQHCPLV